MQFCFFYFYENTKAKKDHYRIPIRKKCHLNFKRIFSCLVVLGIFIVRNQICRLFLVVKRNIMQSSRETFSFCLFISNDLDHISTPLTNIL